MEFIYNYNPSTRKAEAGDYMVYVVYIESSRLARAREWDHISKEKTDLVNLSALVTAFALLL